MSSWPILMSIVIVFGEVTGFFENFVTIMWVGLSGGTLIRKEVGRTIRFRMSFE